MKHQASAFLCHLFVIGGSGVRFTTWLPRNLRANQVAFCTASSHLIGLGVWILEDCESVEAARYDDG